MMDKGFKGSERDLDKMVEQILNRERERNRELYQLNQENQDWKDFIEGQKGLISQIINDQWADDLKQIKEINK